MRYLIALMMMITAVFAVANENLKTSKKLISKRNYDAARIILEAEIKKNSKNVQAHFYLGMTYQSLKNKSKVRAHYAESFLISSDTGKDKGIGTEAGKRLAKMVPSVAPVLAYGTSLMTDAGKFKDPDRTILRRAARTMMRDTIAAILDKKPAEPTRELTESEMEKNLGYDLSWAPRDAVKGPNGHKYKFFKERVTWKQAYDRCKKLGGHLVTVTGETENAFVTKKVIPKSSYAWSGMTGPTEKAWITGEPVSYLCWARSGKKATSPVIIHGVFQTWYSCKWGCQPDRSIKYSYICEWVK